MGAFHAKNTKPKDSEEEEVLKTIPALSTMSTPSKLLDPRSPNPFRTPLPDFSYKDAKPLSKTQDLTNDDNISTTTTVTPTKLKTKLLRDLGYTLDPRSPAVNFNRTPPDFNDLTNDVSLTDLSLSDFHIQTLEKDNLNESYSTSSKLQDGEIDPRSPSIDIERTPLDFSVETIEEDISLQSSVVEEKGETSTSPMLVKNIAVITESVKNMIYMDEHHDQPSTPNIKSSKVEKTENQRTPLSCLVNTQDADKRIERRLKNQNKSNLVRSIFKDSAAPGHQSATKNCNTSTSSSRIPVFRRSCSKDST